MQGKITKISSEQTNSKGGKYHWVHIDGAKDGKYCAQAIDEYSEEQTVEYELNGNFIKLGIKVNDISQPEQKEWENPKVEGITPNDEKINSMALAYTKDLWAAGKIDGRLAQLVYNTFRQTIKGADNALTEMYEGIQKLKELEGTEPF